MKVIHVKLTYFKKHGKYSSEGELDIPYVLADSPQKGELRPPMFHECLEVVYDMLQRGERPGLVDGHDFHTLVTVYTEYGPLPYLYARDRDGKLLYQRTKE